MPKKQLAVYLRLSLEDTGANDESNSITAQRGIIAQFIQGQPELASMKTVEVVDDGYSGTNFDRPGFKRMMAMVRSGMVSRERISREMRRTRRISIGEITSPLMSLICCCAFCLCCSRLFACALPPGTARERHSAAGRAADNFCFFLFRDRSSNSCSILPA